MFDKPKSYPAVIVTDQPVRVVQGKQDKSKSYNVQTMYLLTSELQPFPDKFDMFIDAPLKPGVYGIDLAKSLTVKDGRMVLDRVSFVPQVAAVTSPASTQQSQAAAGK